MLKKYKLSVTTATDGTGSSTGPKVFGKLFAIMFTLGTLDTGAADVTISTVNSDGAATLLTLTNATNVTTPYYVRHLMHGEAGAALTGTAGGDRTMPLVMGTIKMAVAQGGAAHTGSCVLIIEE